MSQRNLLYVGGGLAAVGTYYLYQAGGSPKAAEKRFEHDAAKVGSSIGLVGKEKEAKTATKVTAQDVGNKLDSAVADAKAKTQTFDAKAEAWRQDTEKKIEHYKEEAAKDLHSAVDKFDRTVEQKAAEVKSTAKSTWSSWFGGK